MLWFVINANIHHPLTIHHHHSPSVVLHQLLSNKMEQHKRKWTGLKKFNDELLSNIIKYFVFNHIFFKKDNWIFGLKKTFFPQENEFPLEK